MVRYTLRRLLLLIPVILGVIILVFTMLYIAPGDAASVILGPNYTEEAAKVLRTELGIDKPFIVQFGTYIYNVFIRFDFGKSWISGIPVIEELAARAPTTLVIGTVSIFISMLLGISLGIIAAVHHNKWPDYTSMIVALAGTSLPGFFFALLLVLIFSYKLSWLPAYGMGGLSFWVLPVLSNMFGGMAMQARQARSSMLEVINSDYIMMARSKGLKKRDIIFKHALPNALIPIVTVIGIAFGGVLGGGLIIETVFSIPGVGFYLVTGCNSRDYNVVMGCTIMISVVFSIIMLLTDLAMAAIDPRIKAQFSRSQRRRRA